MKLIQDQTITLGDDRIVLRPTLRCAMVLESRYTFPTLLHDVLSGSLTAIADVIVEASELDHFHVSAMLAYVPAKEAIEVLTPQVFAFVMTLAGYDPNNKQTDQPKQTNKPLSFAEYHTRLFGFGTGVIGWTPRDTWESTPAEILTAYKARQEFVADILKAALGSNEEAKPQDGPVEHTDVEVHEGRAKLKALVMAGANRKRAT